jgi:hypothetical protein
MLPFIFYFYDLTSAFGHPTVVRRGLTAWDAPDGRYNRYFRSVSLVIDEKSYADVFAAIEQIENGLLEKYEFGDGGAWSICLNKTSAIIESDLYEEFNDPSRNTFSLAEFKWVAYGWREFLYIPEILGGAKFSYTLPDNLSIRPTREFVRSLIVRHKGID